MLELKPGCEKLRFGSQGTAQGSSPSGVHANVPSQRASSRCVCPTFVSLQATKIIRKIESQDCTNVNILHSVSPTWCHLHTRRSHACSFHRLGTIDQFQQKIDVECSHSCSTQKAQNSPQIFFFFCGTTKGEFLACLQ